MTPYKDGGIPDSRGRHRTLLEYGGSAEHPERCGRHPPDAPIKISCYQKPANSSCSRGMTGGLLRTAAVAAQPSTERR